MKTSSIYKVAAFFGLILWILVMPLRDIIQYPNAIMVFILGTLPNFGVAIFIPFLALVVMNDYKKNLLNLSKVFYSSIGCLFIFLIASEIFHEIYMDSPFDVYDLLMSIVGFGIDIVLFITVNRINIIMNLGISKKVSSWLSYMLTGRDMEN